MSNEIVPSRSANMPFGDIERLAEAIAKSGMFGMKTKEQALVLMAISQAEGRHPALAARDYDVIQGRPAKKAEAMLRDFLDAGGKVEWHTLSDAKADATFSHPSGGSVRISWDMARAATAQLASKDMFKKFPRQMLRSRTVSEGVRTVWPLATSGFYVPEEAADITPFTGTTIEPDAEPPHDIKLPSEATQEMMKGAVKAPAKATERTEEQWSAWLGKLDVALATLYHSDEIEEMARKPTVAEAHATAPKHIRAEIDRLLAENYARAAKLHTADDGLERVKIVGEENLAAG